jgi:hypothetical protein
MGLSWLNALWTRFTFRTFLLKNAYTRQSLDELVARSRFGHGDVRRDGVGFELRLSR